MREIQQGLGPDLSKMRGLFHPFLLFFHIGLDVFTSRFKDCCSQFNLKIFTHLRHLFGCIQYLILFWFFFLRLLFLFIPGPSLSFTVMPSSKKSMVRQK